MPSPPPTPPPSGRGWTSSQRRLFVIVAAATAVVVLLGLAIFEGGSDTQQAVLQVPSTSTDPSTSATTEPPTTTTQPPQLNQVLDDIEKFVEKERGLQFKSPPQVTLADENEFEQQLLKNFDQELPQLREDQEVFTALGLVPPGTDVVGSMRTLLRASAVGFYDPETKQLYVRGGDATPYVREVLAHELTHALDDQYFNLNRPQLDNADDETGFGFTALAEGDAKRVEDAYVNTFSPSERASAAAEQVQLMLQHPELLTIPAILQTIIAEPYQDGPVLVQALLKAGGVDRLNQAFSAPPTTSEQVLDPSKFLANQGAIAVPPPTSDGPQAAKGVIGAYLLRQALGDSVPGDQADQAVKGWGGDNYVIWEDGTRTCLRDAMVGDNQTDTDTLRQALQLWATNHNAQLSGNPGDPITLTACV
jgi:hypothetical protein